MSRTFVFASVSAMVASLLMGGAVAAQDIANGEELFETCGVCHGVDGAGVPPSEGVTAIATAPAIAGLPSWYVEAQLTKFQTGIRGAHPDDYEGLRMRPMSRSLHTDDADETAQNYKDVAAYIETMPPIAPPDVIEGDAEKGKVLYTPCIACHGVDGSGNQALSGPPLKGLSDWYLVTSIEKYRAGLRGADPSKDPTGALMRPMAMTLANEQAIKDVVAYIRTLDD